jgi:hypothetical protein
MTRRDIENEVQTALRVCKSTGMINKPAMDFIQEAVEEKLARQEECLEVKPRDYVEALAGRVQHLDDKQLGHFVRATLWTTLEKF